MAIDVLRVLEENRDLRDRIELLEVEAKLLRDQISELNEHNAMLAKALCGPRESGNTRLVCGGYQPAKPPGEELKINRPPKNP